MKAAQSSLVTVFCDRTKLPPAGADADCIAYCANTRYPYLCKSGSDDPRLPAREWICTHLAGACGLPVPTCAPVVIDGRDEILFGSLWQGGTRAYSEAFDLVQNSNVFSSTLAFDYASHNIDRHLDNYLYLDVNGQILIMLIDFSRAWDFSSWPMPELPMSPKTLTKLNFEKWSSKYPFIKSDAEKITDRWNSLPKEQMERILINMPDDWMEASDRETLIEWWSSDARKLRGEEARKHLP